MTLRELITELEKLGENHGYNKKVTITDGYTTACYEGKWECKYLDWLDCFDIGIGGTYVEDC